MKRDQRKKDRERERKRNIARGIANEKERVIQKKKIFDQDFLQLSESNTSDETRANDSRWIPDSGPKLISRDGSAMTRLKQTINDEKRQTRVE